MTYENLTADALPAPRPIRAVAARQDAARLPVLPARPSAARRVHRSCSPSPDSASTTEPTLERSTGRRQSGGQTVRRSAGQSGGVEPISTTAASSGGGPGPLPVVDRADVDVGLERGDALEQQRLVELLVQRGGELGGPAEPRHVPLAGGVRDVLDVAVALRARWPRLLAPQPGSPGKPSALSPDRPSQSGIDSGPTPYFSRSHRRRGHSRARRSNWTTWSPADALGQVLVGRADDDLFDPGVIAAPPWRGRTEGVVGLDLDHRPHGHAERRHASSSHGNCGLQLRVDPRTVLVAGPQVVAERLDDVVGGDADVGGTVAQHAHQRPQHAPGGADLVALGVAVTATR